MAHKTLGGYLDSIRDDPAEYRSVSRVVNPMDFDVTAVLQKLEDRHEFPVVEFRNPLTMHGEPSEFPIVSNLWATRERCAEAVGVPRGEAGPGLGVRFSELVGNRLEPRLVSSDDAPVQAHVYRGDDADMLRFPVVKHAEMDLGGATTMALAMHEPDDEFYNVSFVKAFPEPGGRAGLTIHSKDLGRMTRAWQRRGEAFPVINILGAHPGFWLGTLNNTPYGDNEYATIGGFIREPLRLAPSVTWGKDFLVPADAEIIIEGEITPGELTVVEYQGKQAGLQALAHSPNLHTAVVVDDNIDVFNEEEVIWAVNTWVNPARDVDVIRNVSHNGEPSGLGYSKVIIDATRTTAMATSTRFRVPRSALARVNLDDWLDSAKGGAR